MREKIFEREIAIAHGIQTVRRGARETEFVRAETFASNRSAQPASAPEPIGHSSAAIATPAIDAPRTAEKRLAHARAKNVRKRIGWRVLHVRHAGHRHAQVALGLIHKRGDQPRQLRCISLPHL